MSDIRLKGIAVILFGILLSASSAEMNRTVLASFSDFPFAFIGIIAATGRVHGTDDVIAYHVRSMWHTDRQVTLRNSGRNMRKRFCFTRLLRMLLMRYMYNIPVPQTDKGFPFFEKATLAYFPKNIFDLIKRAYRY